MKRYHHFLVIFFSVAMNFSACSVIDSSRAPALEAKAKWALLPMLNNTETPQAGLQAEAILESLLQSNGKALDVQHYPASLDQETLLEPTERRVLDSAIRWAKEQNAQYGITGAVNEWHYKVGIDGEPVVGISLQVIDLRTDQTVWSGIGARTGWGREALNAVAQKLLKELLVRANLIS
jgi:hypothetical protein